jgi:hypothetical protein
MSAKEVTAFCNVINGRLHIVRREAFLEAIAATFTEDCRAQIKITKSYKHHSDKQRGYYRAGLIPCLQQGVREQQGIEISNAEAHTLLKSYCNYKEAVNEETGEVIKLPMGTRHYNTMQFEDYLERCRKFIYEFFGIVVPLPNEQTKLELTNTDAL